MLKLIIGVKGTGKTKALINLVNNAVEASHGSVVCIEKGVKLRYDVKYQARLIDTNEYFVTDAQSLYGFVAGILASNHDVTDLFIDSALKICNNDVAAFEKFIDGVNALSEKLNIRIMMTSSVPVEDATEIMKKYI
jgi:hypothetical protein